MDGVLNVRREVKSYFQELYSDVPWQRPTRDGIDFRCLSVENNNFLLVPFSLDEIKDMVWSCDGDKSPAPDGFNFTFIKWFGGSLKGEIRILIEEFFINSNLPKSVSSSFIALIPKRDNLQKVSDYNPISLIGVLHKLISKLLAARIK